MEGHAPLDTADQRGVGERGDVMLMAVVFVMFLLFGSWAMVSAGQQWGARRDAQAVAAAAARAAAQVGPAELHGGAHLDPGAAQARAGKVLAASGYGGGVSVNGLTVTVTASRRVHYSFPSPGFAGSVTGRASAVAARGVQGDEGG